MAERASPLAEHRLSRWVVRHQDSWLICSRQQRSQRTGVWPFWRASYMHRMRSDPIVDEINARLDRLERTRAPRPMALQQAVVDAASTNPASPTTRIVSNKMRLALVGCGNIAPYHVRAALACGRVQITTLIDPIERARNTITELLSEPPAHFASLTDALAADRETEGGLFEAASVLVIPRHSV